jgi:predicted DNA-binding protein (MmcQ/YjbR family)
MKKITAQSIDAFMNARPFKKDNMTIEVLPNVTVMKLYGNAIAYRFNDPERTLTITNRGWFTNTTKERLNAIPGVHINQKNWQWYLNGEVWDGDFIDVKGLGV